MDIVIDSSLKSMWPETALGVLEYEAEVVKSPDELLDAFEETIEKLSDEYCMDDIAKLQHIAATRKAYKTLGKNPSEYRCRFEKAQTLQIKSTSQMGEEYAREYSHILQTEHIPTWKSPDMEYILQGYCFANGMGALSSNDKNVYARLNAAESELYYIHHSLPYKLGKALCEVRIPFKHQLKSIAFKIYKHST